MNDGGWDFPEGWSDEDKRDWLVTHPEIKDGDPQANGQIALDLDIEDKHGGSGGNVQTELDPNEYGQTDDDKKPVALGIVVPPGKEDEISSDNYSPQEFLLVHLDVWQEFLNGLCDGDDAVKALEGLQKLHRAHMRGMKKVNQHWHGTKRELYRERLLHTRTARKLRKARAGRDRWQRRVAQLENALKQERLVTAGQELYIKALSGRMHG